MPIEILVSSEMKEAARKLIELHYPNLGIRDLSMICDICVEANEKLARLSNGDSALNVCPLCLDLALLQTRKK